MPMLAKIYSSIHMGNLYFRVEELRDSTAHAEIICIREASKLLRTWRLSVTFSLQQCQTHFDLLLEKSKLSLLFLVWDPRSGVIW